MAAPERRPPSVERVIAAARPALGERDHEAVVREARLLVDAERERLAADPDAAARGHEALGSALVEAMTALERGPLGPGRVINATGVILHTNLGRAAWPETAIRAAAVAAAGPSFLELDRDSGRRGGRGEGVAAHLRALTGAEDALVVTNAAAALALAVGLAGRRGAVVVSRGELVEIGGGVRIPEIVRRAGARLVEVGTTNRTRPADFAEGLAGSSPGSIVLRVHPSNFAMAGFVQAADHAEVAAIAHGHGAPVVDDIGSGALLDTAAFGLPHEPTVGERLAAGADLVLFSGDKLLGGPQAGILAGSAALVARLRRDPLARAMRADKTILAALEATLALHRAGVATTAIPVWRTIATPLEALRARAATIAAAAGDGVEVRPTEATVGGGSVPGGGLPSLALALHLRSPDAAAARLRAGSPAILGRVEADLLLLDLRTVDPVDDPALASAIAGLLARRRGS